jgi:ketosteroid isomerase-like protein
MPSANLDLVRSLYAAWERGDYRSAAWADPQIEFSFADGPEPGTWVGREEMAARYGAWLSGWKGFRTDVDEFRALDGERVLVLVRISGRGKTSGLDIGKTRSRGAAAFHLRGGLVVRLILYWDAERALADLGLKE